MLACDSRKPAGQPCKQNQDCADGLVCVSELCAEATGVAKQRAERIQGLVQTYMHEHAGECPGSVDELRFALGSMAPTVRRLRTAEAFVRGQRLTPPVVREAVALLSKDVSPIDDVRSNADYRLAVSRNLLLRFLEGVRS